MKNALILAFLLLSICSYGQKISMNGGKTNAKNYFIKLPYQVVGNHLIVQATVKGKERDFLFDTGASTIVQQTWYGHNGTQKINMQDANDVSDSTGFTIIDSIQIGSVVFENIPAAVLKGDDIVSKCFKIDGLIGSNLLRNSIVQFDTDRKLILITDNEDSLKLSKKHATKLRFDNQSSPFVTVKISETETELILFDSGSSGFYDQSHPYIASYKNRQMFTDSISGFGSESGGIWGFEKEKKQQKFKIPSLKIGNAEIINTWTTITTDWRSRVGLELLDYGKVTIDYRHRKFYFEPKSASQPYQGKSWPIGPTVKDGKLYVGLVWESYADKAKLGDEIVEIDGQIPKPVNTICDLILDSPLRNKQSATLKLKSADGSIKILTINKLAEK